MGQNERHTGAPTPAALIEGSPHEQNPLVAPSMKTWPFAIMLRSRFGLDGVTKAPEMKSCVLVMPLLSLGPWGWGGAKGLLLLFLDPQEGAPS